MMGKEKNSKSYLVVCFNGGFLRIVIVIAWFCLLIDLVDCYSWILTQSPKFNFFLILNFLCGAAFFCWGVYHQHSQDVRFLQLFHLHYSRHNLKKCLMVRLMQLVPCFQRYIRMSNLQVFDYVWVEDHQCYIGFLHIYFISHSETSYIFVKASL